MILNGNKFSLQKLKENTLKNLLEYLNSDSNMIAISINNIIIPITDRKTIILKDSDTVDIIDFVGGG